MGLGGSSFRTTAHLLTVGSGLAEIAQPAEYRRFSEHAERDLPKGARKRTLGAAKLSTDDLDR